MLIGQKESGIPSRMRLKISQNAHSHTFRFCNCLYNLGSVVAISVQDIYGVQSPCSNNAHYYAPYWMTTKQYKNFELLHRRHVTFLVGLEIESLILGLWCTGNQ
jgi:hypothetical protein